MTDPAAIAIAAKLTIVDQEAYGERTLLWVWDDVSYPALVNRLRKLGAWPVLTDYDPVNRPGQVGLVIEKRESRD